MGRVDQKQGPLRVMGGPTVGGRAALDVPP